MFSYKTHIRKERHGINKHRYILVLEWALFGLYGWRWVSGLKEQKFWRWNDAHRQERKELKLAFLRFSWSARVQSWRNKLSTQHGAHPTWGRVAAFK